MSNLNKDALIQLENTASYQPISDLNVTFRTADRESAVFYFNVTKYDKPLLLSNENVKARIAIRKQGVLVIAPMEIEDPFNGLLKYQLPNDVLSRDGNYQAQVLVSEVGESEVAVAERLFTFNVEKSLFSGIDAETKLSYIVEFQDLEKLIMDRVTAIDEALANGEDYVTQVENARAKGLSDIQIALTDALSKIQAQETSSLKAINDKGTEYSTKFDADKQYIDTQSAAFKESVKGSGLVTTGASDSWQKYKLTNDDGTRALVSIGNDVEKLRGLTPGFYYCTTVPITGASSTAGFVTMEMRDSGLKRITFRPYNSNQQFIMRYYNTWGEWELVGLDPANVETVTNSQAKANVAEGNAKSYADTKYASQNTVLFEGTANGVGSVINLSETLDNFQVLYIYGNYPGGYFTELGDPRGATDIFIEKTNIIGSEATTATAFKFGLTKSTRTTLKIIIDNFIGLETMVGSGAAANRFTINRITGVRK